MRSSELFLYVIIFYIYFFIDSFLVCNSFHIMYCTMEGLDEGDCEVSGFLCI